MEKSKELHEKIEEVRIVLNSLIEEKDSLTDSEITYVSELLDMLLNEYHELSNKKDDKVMFTIC